MRSGTRDYARRLGRVYLDWPWPGYLDRHRADTSPLRDDLATYEPLFVNSVRTFREVLGPHVRECRWPMARVWNRWFESVDVELYYCMLRTFRPETVIEVGSGHSTRFAAEALRRNGRGRIVSIDPEPRIELSPEVEHIAARVETVDPSVFEALQPGDVLFIDSSHTAEEARFHVESLFPLLRPGVVCHHHDITFPWAVYPQDNLQTFGEVNVLLDFYLRERASFEVLTGAAYVRFAEPELVRRLVRSYRPGSDRIPASLWTRKIAGGGG